MLLKLGNEGAIWNSFKPNFSELLDSAFVQDAFSKVLNLVLKCFPH